MSMASMETARPVGATPMSGPLCTPVIDLRVVTLSPSHSCSWMTTFSPDSAGRSTFSKVFHMPSARAPGAAPTS
jgi:hypothetical protein